MQATQTILKTVGAARGAFVWSLIIVGSTHEQAISTSLVSLDEHFEFVQQDFTKIPSIDKLGMTMDEAISPAKLDVIEARLVEPVYLKLASLAVIHLVEEQIQTGTILLPKPGVPAEN